MKTEKSNGSEKEGFEPKKLNLFNFLLVQKVCALALEDSKLFAIIGDPGSGKTLALEHFKQMSPKVVKLLSLKATMGINDFFHELGRLFEFEGAARNKHYISNYIKEYCSHIDQPQLLLIEEAARFKPHQFTYLQEIRDISKEKLGIVISGPPDFISKLDNWNRNGVMGVAEFKRRVQMFVRMRKLELKEKISICMEYGIADGKLIKEKFIEYDNIGALTKNIENHLKYNKDLGDVSEP